MITQTLILESEVDCRTYSIPEFKVIKVSESTVAAGNAQLNRADLVADFFRQTVTRAPWYDPEKECFVVLLLDRKNRLKSWNLVSLGSQTAAIAHPREVFRAACIAAACAVVCIHNHPSGDPSPSAADIKVTRQMREAGATLGIQVLDHVVIGTRENDPMGQGYYSFREAGLV